MGFEIGMEERRVLLAAARESIASKLETRVPAHLEFAADSGSALKKPCGAFVTLHMTDAAGKLALRGCIGRLSATLPLEETVRAMARSAAFEDPRFPALEKGELPRCRIEISALSPMSRCADPGQIKVGVHGLCLAARGRSGVLLPQVPVEQRWNLGQYLDYICIKAGLPAGSHEAPDAELSTFTAVVFGEEWPVAKSPFPKGNRPLEETAR